MAWRLARFDDAFGVGSVFTSIDSGVNVDSRPSAWRSRSWYCSTVPPGSCAAGVGSMAIDGEDEEPGTRVAGPDVGRSYNHPLRIEPEGGKVTEHGVESESKVPIDVLKHDESGS